MWFHLTPSHCGEWGRGGVNSTLTAECQTAFTWGLAGSSNAKDSLPRKWDLSPDENQGRLRPESQGVPSSEVSSLHCKLAGPRVCNETGTRGPPAWLRGWMTRRGLQRRGLQRET